MKTDLHELIEETQRIAEDASEAVKRSRTRRTKRNQKNVFDLFSNINKHLVELKNLKEKCQ